MLVATRRALSPMIDYFMAFTDNLLRSSYMFNRLKNIYTLTSVLYLITSLLFFFTSRNIVGKLAGIFLFISFLLNVQLALKKAQESH